MSGDVIRHLRFSLSKKYFFDRLAEVKETPKTSNSTPKCISILEWGELRWKSKRFSKQIFPTSVKNQRFLIPSPEGEGSCINHHPKPSNTRFDGLGVL